MLTEAYSARTGQQDRGAADILGEQNGEASRISGGGHEQSHGGNAETGWEPEREIYLTAQRLSRMQAQAKLEASADSDSISIGAADFLCDIAALASIIEEPDYDEDEDYPEVDSKTLMEIARKKESLGMKMW